MFFDSKLPSYLLEPYLGVKISTQSPQTSTSQASKSTDSVPKPSMLEQFMPFAFILFIVYFLFIRPQQKRARKHVEFINHLKVGDSVLTSGGILGKVDGLTDQYAILMISDGVKIRVLRSHISSFSQNNNNKEAQNSKRSPIVNTSK